MNSKLLKERLKRLDVPMPDTTVRERTLHRSLIAFRHAWKTEEVHERTGNLPVFWRWAAAVSVIGTASMALWLGGQSVFPKDALAKWGKTIRQMEILFPGQLNAVIEHDGDVELDLTAEPAMPSEQPVMVEISRGAHVLRVLSYSGRRVRVNLDGKNTCFEALVTGDGNVILTGDDFLWISRNLMPRAGYRVEAHSLNPAS